MSETAKMEARVSKRRNAIRKPFSDCTNSIDSVSPSQSSYSSTKSSSCTIKPRNLISSKSVKTSFAANPSRTQFHPATRPGTTGKNDKLSKSSADLIPFLSTPSHAPEPSFPQDSAEAKAFEPSSVYVRRQSTDKRKRKEIEIDAVKNCLTAIKGSKRVNTNEDEVLSLSKSRPAPSRKKRGLHCLPQDFIEQKRAYFAEVDAFELSEEEVDEHTFVS